MADYDGEMRRSLSSEVQLFRTLPSLQQLAETRRFKAWFLDQFGVLHDGKQPYPGAISTLEKSATNGAKMVIIKLMHQYLQGRDDPWFAALGRSSCIHITWGDRGAISRDMDWRLSLNVVENVEKAEFVLVHGTEALGLPSGNICPVSIGDLEKILEQCASKRIPMIVANPDFVTVEARSLLMTYDAWSFFSVHVSKYLFVGSTFLSKWMGKPDKIIYKSAMQCSFGQVADLSSVQALAAKYDAHPTYMLPAFAW
ncbi:hypothetical protein SLA2020_079880 [Shorea laevis]